MKSGGDRVTLEIFRLQFLVLWTYQGPEKKFFFIGQSDVIADQPSHHSRSPSTELQKVVSVVNIACARFVLQLCLFFGFPSVFCVHILCILACFLLFFMYIFSHFLTCFCVRICQAKSCVRAALLTFCNSALSLGCPCK